MRLARYAVGGVGVMLVVTWLFGVAGQHTPFTFAMAAVGCTGMGLVWAVVADTLTNPSLPAEGDRQREGERR